MADEKCQDLVLVPHKYWVSKPNRENWNIAESQYGNVPTESSANRPQSKTSNISMWVRVQVQKPYMGSHYKNLIKRPQ